MGNSYITTQETPVGGMPMALLVEPTFTDVKLVEDTLREAGLIKKETLRNKLKGKINPTTLKHILFYFERERLIYTGEKGISWLLNDNPTFKKLLAKAITVR